MHSIVIANLSYSENNINLLKDINLTMESGRVYGLLGSKHTETSALLSLMDGYTVPGAGTIRVNGEEPFENHNVRRNIEYQFPKNNVYEARQAVHHFELLKDYNENFDVAYALNLLQDYGIKETQMVSALDQNLSAAVDAVSALASQKPIILLDGLHHRMTIRTRGVFYQHINEAASPERLIVIASKEADEIEHLIDEVAILHGGRMLIHEDAGKILKRGFRVTGSLNNVLQIARNKTVIHEAQHGEVKSVIMLGTLRPEDKAYIDRHRVYYAPLRIQELFEHLTGGGTHEE